MNRSFLYGALTAAAGYKLVRSVLVGQHPEWIRRNYRDREVSLSGGVAVAGTLCAQTLPFALIDTHYALAHALTTAAAATCGYIDDQPTEHDQKGFTGHLGALAEGRVTTGTAKILGIGGGALAAAIAYERGLDRSSLIDVVINTGLIAGSANIINLLDLRPGRALKVGLIAGLAARDVPQGAAAGACAAVSACALPTDLDETHMLGDAGANPLGAALGLAVATHPSRGTRLVGLALLVALTAASEKISFSQVISTTPLLRHLDALGRRA